MKPAACCPSPNREPDRRPRRGAVADRDLARLAKAVGHPARVRILRLLAARGDCVCGSIVAEIGLAQSTVSQHLKVLRTAGLIRGTISGPRTCYCIEPSMLRRFRELVGGLG